MSEGKILHAAMDAFKQNFTAMCRDSGIMFDKVDEKVFSALTMILMDAARAAGAAGLEEYLKENDTVCPTIVRDDRVYRYKGTCTNEILTLFGTITVDRVL